MYEKFNPKKIVKTIIHVPGFDPKKDFKTEKTLFSGTCKCKREVAGFFKVQGNVGYGIAHLAVNARCDACGSLCKIHGKTAF